MSGRRYGTRHITAPSRLRAGVVFRRGFGLLGHGFGPVALTSLPILAPLIWVWHTVWAAPADGHLLFRLLFLFFLLAGTQIFLSALLAPVAGGDSPAFAFPRWPTILFVASVLGFFFVIAILWAGLGGIVLIWLFFLAGPVSSMEETGFRSALTRSYQISENGRGTVALLLIPILLFTGAAALAPLLLGPAGEALLPLVVLLSALLQAVAYDELANLEAVSSDPPDEDET